MSALVMRAEDGDVLGESAARWFDSATAAERALLARLGQLDPDERMALAGDYRPLVPLLSAVDVGTLTLELCTHPVDDVADVVERAEKAIGLFGAERVLLNPDCGFATFADNPIVSADVAEAKLAVLAQVRDLVRDRHGI